MSTGELKVTLILEGHVYQHPIVLVVMVTACVMYFSLQPGRVIGDNKYTSSAYYHVLTIEFVHTITMITKYIHQYYNQSVSLCIDKQQ